MTTNPTAADRARGLLADAYEAVGFPEYRISLMSTANGEMFTKDVQAALRALTELAAENEAHEQRIKRLEDALGEYGGCKPLCARIGGYGYCDCGYEAALRPKIDEGIGPIKHDG